MMFKIAIMERLGYERRGDSSYHRMRSLTLLTNQARLASQRAFADCHRRSGNHALGLVGRAFAAPVEIHGSRLRCGEGTDARNVLSNDRARS